MTLEETIRVLARWVRELQADVDDLRERNQHLETRAQLAQDVRWWMDRHTPAEIRELAEAL